MSTTDESKRPDTAAGRRPYEPPVLRVFGSVTEITASVSMSGSHKDGGPNNLKT
jgi:hypothetical protein